MRKLTVGKSAGLRSIWCVEDHRVLTSRMSINAVFCNACSARLRDIITSASHIWRRWGLDRTARIIFRSWNRLSVPSQYKITSHWRKWWPFRLLIELRATLNHPRHPLRPRPPGQLRRHQNFGQQGLWRNPGNFRCFSCHVWGHQFPRATGKAAMSAVGFLVSGYQFIYLKSRQVYCMWHAAKTTLLRIKFKAFSDTSSLNTLRHRIIIRCVITIDCNDLR